MAMMMIETTFLPNAFVVPSPATLSPMVATTTSGPRKRRRKKVSFFPHTLIKDTLHRNDYTEEEIRKTWLTADDLCEIKRSCRRTVIKFSKPQPPNSGGSSSNDDERHCLRGLEGKTRQGVSRRKRIKWAARNAVLCEQRVQLLEGIADGERLADVYYEHTEYPQVEAHMVGLRDRAGVLRDDADCEPRGAPMEPLFPASLGASQSKARRDPPGFRRCFFVPAHVPIHGDGTRNLQSSTPTRRLLTDAFFRV